jgi:hypothetical protein
MQNSGHLSSSAGARTSLGPIYFNICCLYVEIKDAYEGRKILRFCILFVFLLLTLIVGLLAGVFYSLKLQSCNLTPPESRDRNQLCSFGDFFDNHDMWHFLSSTSLFLAFIFLLTIDDDLFMAKRTYIQVF